MANALFIDKSSIFVGFICEAKKSFGFLKIVSWNSRIKGNIYSKGVFNLDEIKDVPNELEVLEVMNKRSFSQNHEDARKLKRLRAGAAGEEVVADYLNKYGSSKWSLMQNFWLDYFGTLECDGLLLTGRDLYVLEVKNYSGLYEYENGISKLNHRELSVNPIYQTQKATMKVRELVSSRFPNIKVHGVLIFVGIDSQIRIKSEGLDILIVQRHELKGLIESIAEEEVSGWSNVGDLNDMVQFIQAHQTKNPYPVEPLTPEDLAGLQKGILCENCANSTVAVTKKFVKCKCGHIESREKATIRTICEYGVLNFTKPLTANALLDFFNGQASRGYIIKVLKNHFRLISRGREDYYENNFRLYTKKI